ncbi:MAG: quinon protein alcohol dehydrogenase-like superfamily [Benniella sp.]|nr:MAG: quinon protein alcohol dehydrogenase-like superfamily [Benniella sp.]
MVFNNIVSSPLGNLSLQHALDLTNIYLENASKAQHSDIALVLCHDAEVALSQAKKSAKRIKDQAMLHGIATAYIGLGRELDNRGRTSEAQESYKKAEKWGPTLPAERKIKQGNFIATIPQHIFAENIPPPSIVTKLPDIDARLTSTPQLACCLSLLKASHSLDDVLEPIARTWIQAVEKDEDEKERLKVLSLDVIRAYKRDELKDAKVVAEVVYLAPVLEKDMFRDLLKEFYDGVDRSALLDFYQLDGLAQLIQGADTGYLDADDLVKILGLVSTRLRQTHQQSQKHMYQLTLTASHVLDAMADTKVDGLDREKLHEPLSVYLDSLKESPDPYLVYQAAYAYQALQCVPDDETLWQATLRRTGKVIQGVSGLVSAVKGLDLNGFVDGLKDIQQGMAGASEVIQTIKSAYDGANSLVSGGQGFIEGLKEGLSFKRKCAWYPALRGADALIRDGEFSSFKKLVCEAPCRMDPAFQWGVCQRLGELAGNPMWDILTRRSAVAFLGEIYCNDEEWGQDVGIKEWILDILKRLSSPSEGVVQFAEGLLQELESKATPQQRILIRTYRQKNTISYPLRVVIPTLMSTTLLDRVQSKPDVEGSLRQLRKQRLKERGNAVYIQPQAKVGLQASDEQRFPLMKKVEDFLKSNQSVFLLLGDSGAGKSTFNRQLEYELWNTYKKNTGRIPLFINLPAIDKPEQDMIAKHLRRSEFTEPEIRELKVHRKFILICDGYDESQQTHNLYVSNRLNQPGEWSVQMVVSCRSEYLGTDYRDRFQPGDRNSRPEPGQFQEAVITPFTPDQVQDYINQYVSVHQPLWEAKDYEQALDLISGLRDLVRNPFLMSLSLEVLPRMVDPGEHLSATRVTRVALYDQFIEHWLERGKKRLSEKELSPQAKAAFESLIDEGFTQNGIDFLKRLTVAIYKEQDGQPVVKYSRFKDEKSWKTEFFSREDEKQLLREACPLTRSGNQHRFIHRSLLEYGLALAIFDPNDWKEKPLSLEQSGRRRGSTSSVFSFRIRGTAKAVISTSEQGIDLDSPLTWRYFIDEPSLLQFLTERVQQEPVFKQQLLDYIEHSKTDKDWRTAASNAITILVRAGVQFNHEDLRGIQIPGADLSYGVFESAQLQGADLRQVTLRGTCLSRADLSRAKMTAVQFGELPFLNEDAEVYSCAYSPDGKSLAVGLSSGDIKVYSTSSWEHVRTLTGHKEKVWSIAYAPNGDQIISGSNDSTARLWDVGAGTCLYTLTGHDREVNGVAFAPCGGSVASASDDSTVRVWDVGTGECRHILIGHRGIVISVAYSPRGHLIASGGWIDNTVRLWDVQTGERLHILSDHTDSIYGVTFSPRGDRVVSSSGDKTLRMWDVDNGTCSRVLTGHTNGVRNVAFSPQGDVIASSSDDKTVRIWNADTGVCHQILLGHSGVVRCVAFSPEGGRIACGSEDNTVRVWDVGFGATRQIASGHSGEILSVKYSPRGDQVASCSEDGSIRLWDVETGNCHRILAGHTDWVRDIAYSPRGDLVVSGSDDCTVKLWDVETGTCCQTFNGHTNYVYVVAYSPQGNQVASGSRDKSVRIWDIGTGECRHTLRGHTDWVRSVMYSPKGNKIASSSYDSTIRLWDVESGVCLHTLRGHNRGVTSTVYSPRSDLLASASGDCTVRLWDVEAGECRYIFIGHTKGVGIVVYSPQGGQVASGGNDGQLKLWDDGTGECIHTLAGHTERVTSVVFSSSGDQIVSGSEDKTVRLWSVASGQCQAVIQDLDSSIRSIAWSTSPDISYFVTGCEDGSVRMWKVVEESGVCHVHVHWRPVNGELNVTETSIQDVHGLSQLNKQLLKQRGAVGTPLHADRLRDASKQVLSMVSVISTLKQPLTGETGESSPASNLVNEEPGHPEQPAQSAE